jgi:hypothetical protein
LSAAAWHPAAAQDMPKSEYFRYVPLEVPRLVRQTAPSAALHLYGNPLDPDYRDEQPRDGIDDRRHAVLQRMAVRFAPLMVLNTTNIPMDFRVFARGQDAYKLHVDHWNTVAEDGTLVREETIDLLNTLRAPCNPYMGGARGAVGDDCRLLELLDRYDADRPVAGLERARAMEPDRDLFQVLYIDFPGSDEETWRAEFQDKTTGRLPAKYREALSAYVHPFIDPVVTSAGDHGYELVLQYWFFYPYNDGGNNHKGDWEHINVTVSPRAAVGRLLDGDDIGAILDGAWIDAEAGGELVIKRIDYYFHHKVLILDFASPNVYLPRDEWQAELRSKFRERISEDWFWKQIRRRAYRDAAETEINTHPVVFIGADNKGFDQILAMPGGKNRDSHGSFPFPGLYKDIGPGGATEEISTSFDHQRFFSASPAEQNRLLTIWKRGGVVSLAQPDVLEILPDWEHLRDLVRVNPRVRADRAWMLLPVRFGYPASESPFAGIVAHAETGNLSILGPAFSTGWNRAGASAGFADYQPHKVPRLFPLGVQDAFRNSWGFFNVFAALTVLPPVDFAWRILAAPVRLLIGRQDPTFYPQENIPFRFFGLTGGISTQPIPLDFLELAITEDQFDDVLLSILDFQLTRGDTTSVVVGEEEFADNATVPYYQLSFFIGPQFVSENVLRHSRSRLGLRVRWSDITDVYELSGLLNLWEYAGSLRHNFATGNFLPYAKLGYGISGYRLEGLTGSDGPLPTPNSRWIVKWTWHVGAGVELVTIRNYSAPPGGIDVSLRGDWTMYLHGLGLEVGNLPIQTLALLGRSASDLPRDRWIARHEWRLGLTLGF